MDMKFFEATPQQRQLADIGRGMMNISERANCKGLKEEGFKLLNELSRVGNMMTKVGVLYGTKLSDFTDEDKRLIASFMQGELDIPQMPATWAVRG
jgi:hypothetical protein